MKELRRLEVPHTKYKGTRQQRANVEMLAKYLMRSRKPEKSFDMLNYVSMPSNRYPTERPWYCAKTLIELTEKLNKASSSASYPCGSTACALGHGPLAGIPAAKHVIKRFGSWQVDWDAYRKEHFGKQSAVFIWCFSVEWIHHDNTRKGAALRLRYILKYGLPVSESMFEDKMHRLWVDELARITS